MPQGEYLQYGGQAIVEGVMMRSPRFFSVACRAPNGKIVLQTEAIEKTWVGRQKWLKLPFLRGTLALLDSMALGMKAMRFASHVQLDAAYSSSSEPLTGIDNALQSKKVQNAAIGITLAVSIIIGLFIFNFLPNLIAEGFRRFGVHGGTAKNIVAETVKGCFFLGYIWAIGRLPDIKEVFRYHGAEHKAINTLESEQPLDMNHCKAQSRFHPRCGTSFAVIVLLVGFVLFTFVPRYPITGHEGSWYIDVPVRVGVEILILPFIAGISYELLRLAGKFRNEAWVNAAFKPGILTQYLTTVEPLEPHIEVALVSLQAVLEAEKSGKLSATEDLLEASPASAIA